MRKSVTSAPDRLTVLSVSPAEEDHSSLQSIIDHANPVLFKARNLVTALDLLEEHDIAVALCERDLLPGNWIDMLENIRHLAHPPSLIVTSRLADDRLWCEALNRGAWDVLAKPFDYTEVIRTVRSAWQHWRNPIQRPALTMKLAAAS